MTRWLALCVVLGVALPAHTEERLITLDCDAQVRYGQALLYAKRLGQTRSQADVYALDRLPRDMKYVAEASRTWRQGIQEIIYTRDISPLELELAMRGACMDQQPAAPRTPEPPRAPPPTTPPDPCPGGKKACDGRCEHEADRDVYDRCRANCDFVCR
jgi:hypothetical protein